MFGLNRLCSSPTLRSTRTAQKRAAGKLYVRRRPQTMKLSLVFIVALLVSLDAFATRNLVLSPSEVTYKYEGGYTLTIKTTQDGTKLTLFEISNGREVVSVPQKELESVDRPVLNNVSVSGGAAGSDNIEVPSGVTIGYGAYQCYSGKCPKEIIFFFEGGKYLKSMKLTNKNW